MFTVVSDLANKLDVPEKTTVNVYMCVCVCVCINFIFSFLLNRLLKVKVTAQYLQKCITVAL